MTNPDENVRLNDLMFRALDHGIESVSAGGSLIPFVMSESGINRFATETLEEGKLKAEEFLLNLTEEQVAALVYDGYQTREGTKYDAIFVKAYDKDQEKGIWIAQAYKPKRLLKKFTVIGNPVFIENIENPLFKK